MVAVGVEAGKQAVKGIGKDRQGLVIAGEERRKYPLRSGERKIRHRGILRNIQMVVPVDKTVPQRRQKCCRDNNYQGDQGGGDPEILHAFKILSG